MRSSVAIVGAGAIGCWLADALDRAGWAVSMLARGPTLAALRSDGLIVERGGEITSRLEALVTGLRAGGINAELSRRIRHEVWAKLWGNMNMNPLSALTRRGTARMLGCPEIRDLCVRMMEEMQVCGNMLDLQMNMMPAERIAVTQRLGDFRPSMLADLLAGRPLELAPQLGAVVEIAQRLGVPAPFMRSVLGLTRLISPA